MKKGIGLLAKGFVYDEVRHAPGKRIRWHDLADCFVAWLKFHDEEFDYPSSTTSHWLSEAIKEQGFQRSRANLLDAQFYLGSTKALLADLALDDDPSLVVG